MKYPQIYLALDNCFAIKRWAHPGEWMKRVAEIGGIKYIEASTDNEIDPLFNTPQYRREWIKTVKQLETDLDLKICSFYSGYATYRTTGLTHFAKSSREKLRKAYFEKVVDIAGELDACVGCALSAFPEDVLEDPVKFAQGRDHLGQGLGAMAEYAAKKGVLFAYEQMYSPNLGFWLIDECRDWMKTIRQKTGAPMYITIDTAHQVGQRNYLRPDADEVFKAVQNKSFQVLWLGSALQKKLAGGALDRDEIEHWLDKYEYLFSAERDGDLYQWVEELGCYSPVYHLQQTDGTFSSHKPFTEKWNKNGIVKPDKLFKAIAKAYETENDPDMPPRADKIYLAFELFFGINERPESILEQIKESVAYWRSFIPEDGITVDRLIK